MSYARESLRKQSNPLTLSFSQIINFLLATAENTPVILESNPDTLKLPLESDQHGGAKVFR
ncbi:hypothetical protein ACT4MW_22430 [Pseudomonas brassicacearum subsp. neoaurantiaca]|uniref:hypothetical protein n=1 Tax=Pseudomonas brassicacearum TaxID=930166 RepID=UPI0040353DB0